MGYRNFLYSVVCFFVVLCLSECTTSRVGVPSDTLLDYQRQIAILEGRLDSFTSGLGEVVAGLDDLTDRSANITGGIDEIIVLFDEYQRRVDELVSVYRELVRSSRPPD